MRRAKTAISVPILRLCPPWHPPGFVKTTQADRSWPWLRTASVTLAPALASAREVANPRPDAPPVTIALRRLSDRALTAPSEVVRAPKSDVIEDEMGDCGVVGKVLWNRVRHASSQRAVMLWLWLWL